MPLCQSSLKNLIQPLLLQKKPLTKENLIHPPALDLRKIVAPFKIKLYTALFFAIFGEAIIGGDYHV